MNTNYYDSFNATYTLGKSSDGTSTLSIEENITAVFPNYNTSHGISLCTPTAYRGVKSLLSGTFTATRNGAEEPFSTFTEGDETCLRVGSANSYVNGTQNYIVTYKRENVILAPENSKNQEFYWDTNGTGSSVSINSLSAKVVLEDGLDSSWLQDASCYVGVYGIKGEEATSRCKIEKSEKEILFSTENLAAGENLTFDIGFKPDTFKINTPPKNYAPIAFLGISIAIFIASIVSWKKSFAKIKEKRDLAKSKITAPEFTPKLGFTAGEMSLNYLGTLRNPRVASLLELAVAHKIELKKGDKKLFGGYKWKILVKNLDDVSREQEIVLEILNGGSSVSVGEEIEVKSYTSTSHLRSLNASYETSIISSLEKKGLFVEKKEREKIKSGKLFAAFILIFIISTFFFTSFATQTGVDTIIDAAVAAFLIYLLFFVYIFAFAIVHSTFDKYASRTIEGIKASKYLDGLKRYMSLAEKDRISFLQSVKGADTTHEGIVKLYEKLLPYAVLFGIEESWMKELNNYYKFDDVSDPDWVMRGVIISGSDFRSFTSTINQTIASSTISESSGSSSGFSGGGGGGFSGGGGGGGGHGTW